MGEKYIKYPEEIKLDSMNNKLRSMINKFNTYTDDQKEVAIKYFKLSIAWWNERKGGNK